MPFVKSLGLALPAAIAAATAFAFALPAPSRADTSAGAACAARNPSLAEYTFDMNVAMRMRHFPWLGFHLAGSGRYVRGQSHVVDFTQLPFFAKGFNEVDLSPLDPCIWPRFYAVTSLGTRDGLTTFSLRPRRADPQDKNRLVEALVTLDSSYATRNVVLHYENGSITIALTPGSILGYRLPADGEVSIDMPGRSLSAHADFTNYSIVSKTTDGSGRRQ